MLLSPAVHTADLVIVIDDIGYDPQQAERFLRLPGKITLGVLPYAPYSRQIARRAEALGQEVILHQPMEPLPAAHVRPVRGTLTLGMSDVGFDDQFSAALANVPNAVGVNNHTGSLLTQHQAPMNRLMGNIYRRGLLFLDSRTTPYTVAEATAREWRVPTIHRDVFLDHVRNPAAIQRAYARALQVARRKGRAVVIAHPYSMSLGFLREKLDQLPADIQLRTLVDLLGPARGISTPDRTTLARREGPASPSISLGQ